MEQTSGIVNFRNYEGKSNNSIIDTSFVLLFLAMDFGQNFGAALVETIFMAIVLLSVAALPFFLPGDEIEFSRWFIGRSIIVLFGVLLGIVFKLSLGVVLPEVFSFLPFTLLMLTAVLFCFMQFFNFFRFRFSN